MEEYRHTLRELQGMKEEYVRHRTVREGRREGGREEGKVLAPCRFVASFHASYLCSGMEKSSSEAQGRLTHFHGSPSPPGEKGKGLRLLQFETVTSQPLSHNRYAILLTDVRSRGESGSASYGTSGQATLHSLPPFLPPSLPPSLSPFLLAHPQSPTPSLPFPPSHSSVQCIS